MKPRTPGFWLIVATIGLLAMLPMKAEAEKTPYTIYKAQAERGEKDSQRLLGGCYANGEGVLKDEVEAAKWYRKSAEQGDGRAQDLLGACYENGRGVAKDAIEAAKWYRKAADSRKEYDLFIRGRIAESRERSKGDARAQYNLGVYLFNDPNGFMDKVEAIKLFKQSAENGFVMAHYVLGKLYHLGESVARDEVEAYAYFSLASASVEEAKDNLLIIEKEMSPEVRMRGKQRHEALKKVIEANEAIIAAKKAADAKRAVAEVHAKAQLLLGYNYIAGEGVAKDEVEAYAYFSLAGAWLENAKRMQTKMETYLSSQQITAGKERALELQKESEAKIAAKIAEQTSQQITNRKKRTLELQKEIDDKNAGK
jgi:hypothetical protein